MWGRLVLLGLLGVMLLACARYGPTPVPTTGPTQTPELVPTATPLVEEVEGLVMADDGQLIVGVNWLSRSRVTYRVSGGDMESLRKFVDETVRVRGEIVERSPWLKEITVRAVQASAAANRLSRRIGYIAELGVSIYMQGTHVLTTREGKLICLLGAAEGGPDLNKYMGKKVAVIGVLEKTVEGNAQIMKVQLVEIVK